MSSASTGVVWTRTSLNASSAVTNYEAEIAQPCTHQTDQFTIQIILYLHLILAFCESLCKRAVSYRSYPVQTCAPDLCHTDQITIQIIQIIYLPFVRCCARAASYRSHPVQTCAQELRHTHSTRQLSFKIVQMLQIVGYIFLKDVPVEDHELGIDNLSDVCRLWRHPGCGAGFIRERRGLVQALGRTKVEAQQGDG